MIVTGLAVAAAAWGVLMGVSPVLQIRRMVRQRSSRDVSIGYFAILLVGFVLWLSYGVAARNLALIVPNAVALLIGASTIAVALRLGQHAGGPGRARQAGTMGHVLSLAQTLEMLAESTASLMASAGLLTDEQARGPSLLPGWTRGHLLTHVARNAEGGTRLLGWARTGVPGYEYRSVAARAAAIEEGAGRPAAVLAGDVRATAAAFAAAAAAVPPGAWEHVVTWTAGQQTPADMIVRSRLGEVMIHHVDLNTGYGPGSSQAAFVAEMIGLVASAFRNNPLVPTAIRLTATDTGRACQTGAALADGVAVRGTEADLLAWLLGRSGGARLAWDGAAELPPLPSPWTT